MNTRLPSSAEIHTDSVLEVKAIPIQPWTDPKGSRRARLPEVLDNRRMNVARLSALRTGRLYSPVNTPGTHFF